MGGLERAAVVGSVPAHADHYVLALQRCYKLRLLVRTETTEYHSYNNARRDEVHYYIYTLSLKTNTYLFLLFLIKF